MTLANKQGESLLPDACRPTNLLANPSPCIDEVSGRKECVSKVSLCTVCVGNLLQLPKP